MGGLNTEKGSQKNRRTKNREFLGHPIFARSIARAIVQCRCSHVELNQLVSNFLQKPFEPAFMLDSYATLPWFLSECSRAGFGDWGPWHGGGSFRRRRGVAPSRPGHITPDFRRLR